MRDSFIFYRSIYEAIKELDNATQLQVYQAIAEFSLDFKEPDLSGLPKTIFTLIRPSLDANNKRYMNGKQPKQKQNRSKTEARKKQEKSKTEAYKDKDKYKDEENKKTKKEQLIEEAVSKLKEDNHPITGMTLDRLSDFYDYRNSIKDQIKTYRPLVAYTKELVSIHKDGINVDNAIALMKDKEWHSISLEWIKNAMPMNHGRKESIDLLNPPRPSAAEIDRINGF